MTESCSTGRRYSILPTGKGDWGTFGRKKMGVGEVGPVVGVLTQELLAQ